VYATDVQDVMLERLRARVASNGLHNVQVVPAAFDDPTLPDGCCDVIFFSSVYKEIDDRVPYMQKVAHALKRHGRVAILEYRLDTRGYGPPREMRLDPEVVVSELANAGFTLVARHDFIDRQYLLVFSAPWG
jgi:ubiquinone/menaquinone biosynthesis C-methylase UbiE